MPSVNAVLESNQLMATQSNVFSWQALSTSEVVKEQVAARQEWLQAQNKSADLAQLFKTDFELDSIAKKNCENVIGSVEIPVGVAGPLSIHTENWQSQAVIPLATTEGALVASINRGCKALNLAGGVSVMVEKRGMTRSPVFECTSGLEAKRFLQWFEDHIDRIKEIAESTSSHLHLLSHHSWIRGRYVYVRFAFDTEEAMGMKRCPKTPSGN